LPAELVDLLKRLRERFLDQVRRIESPLEAGIELELPELEL
jgi:hypothetical protein